VTARITNKGVLEINRFLTPMELSRWSFHVGLTLKPSRVSPIDWMKSIEKDESTRRRNCAGLLQVRLYH
jgi:hypothetical protein